MSDDKLNKGRRLILATVGASAGQLMSRVGPASMADARLGDCQFEQLGK